MSSFVNATWLKLTDHWKILKLFLLCTNCAALVIYIFLRLSLYEAHFSIAYEITVFLKAISVSSIIAVSLYSLIPAVELAEKIWMSRSKLKFDYSGSLKMLFVIFVLLNALSCQSQTIKGVKRDLNTGLRTTYENIEPHETELVMNGEVLGHTDIPLGEDFIIVNKGVKGLVTKEGKVSVGCSLLITDKKANVLLKVQDLFKDDGIIDAVRANYLKCIVSTGKPMAWDEKYNVHVTFWDKWGKGRIVNDVSIRMIDIP